MLLSVERCTTSGQRSKILKKSQFSGTKVNKCLSLIKTTTTRNNGGKKKKFSTSDHPHHQKETPLVTPNNFS